MTSESGRRWRLGGIAVVVACALAGPARANMAAPQRYPSVIVRPSAAAPTPLAVQRERLIIDCDGVRSDDSPSCRFEATYWLANPTPQPQRVTTGFLSERTEDVQIFVGGRRVDRALTPVEAEALVPERVPAASDGPPRFAQPPTGIAPSQPVPSHDAWSREDEMLRHQMREAVEAGPVRGADLFVAPGAVLEVTATGRLLPGEYWTPGHYFAYPPREARHPLLEPERRSGVFEIEYFIAPIRTWGGVGPIEVIIRYPAEWKATTPSVAGEAHGTSADGRAEVRFVTDANAMPMLHLGFELPVNRFHPGGPVAGIGGTFGDAGGFRMRFGWELSAPDWLLYSATADTDFDEVLVVTPMVEAATPWILVIPSVGAGLGLPVRLRPEKAVGVRLQSNVAFGPAAWVTSFDLYPGLDSDRPDAKQVTMLFQLTL